MQVFGKDTLLAMGGESAESRQQWAEDMDVDVGSHAPLCTSLAFCLHWDVPGETYLHVLYRKSQQLLKSEKIGHKDKQAKRCMVCVLVQKTEVTWLGTSKLKS